MIGSDTNLQATPVGARDGNRTFFQEELVPEKTDDNVEDEGLLQSLARAGVPHLVGSIHPIHRKQEPLSTDTS